MFQRKLSLMKPAAVFYLVVAAFSFGITCSVYMWLPSSGQASVVLVVMGLVIGT